jgi:hypothetical protein
MPYATDKQVRLPLDPDQYQQVRELAAKAGVPMSVLVRREITRFLSEQKVSRPGQESGRERRGK